MKNFQILRYLKRFLPLIIVFCLLATYAVYFKLSRANTYIASEVIHYNDEQAEKGLKRRMKDAHHRIAWNRQRAVSDPRS